MFSYISKCFRSLSRAPGVCLMSLVSHGCSRSSDLRRSAYFDHLSGLRKRWSKKAERRFCKLGLFRPPFSDSGKMVEKGRASILQARLISTTFPEVVEKGRASILQARLISTTSSESGHAVMYGPESHKHENVDSGPRRLIG